MITRSQSIQSCPRCRDRYCNNEECLLVDFDDREPEEASLTNTVVNNVEEPIDNEDDSIAPGLIPKKKRNNYIEEMGEKIQRAAEPSISSRIFTNRIQELMNITHPSLKQRRNQVKSNDSPASILKLVQKHLKNKNVSKAVKTITNLIGLVDIEIEENKNKLMKLYPRDSERQEFSNQFENDDALINKICTSTCDDQFASNIKEYINGRNLQACKATNGHSHDDYKKIIKNEEYLLNLLTILNRINSGFLLESVGKATLIECKGIPLQKGTDGIRPISSLNPLFNYCGKLLSIKHKEELKDAVGSEQLGIERGGVEAAGMITEFLLQANTERIALQIDIRNAYNSPNHIKLLEIIKNDAPYLYEFSKLTMGTKVGKTKFNNETIELQKGIHQGGTLSTTQFCIGLHSVLKPIIELGEYSDVQMVNISDNITIIGFPDKVLKMSKDIKKALDEKLDLKLAPEKSIIYGFNESYAQVHIQEATDSNFIWMPARGGVTFAGTPIGSETYRKNIFDKKAKEINENIKKICNFYDSTKNTWNNSKQALIYMLRNCIPQQAVFLTRVLDPNITREGCKAIDICLINAVFHILGIIEKIPRENSRELDLLKKKLFLPIKLGGFGLLSLEKIHEASFYGNLIDNNRLFTRYISNAETFSNINGNFKTFQQLDAKLKEFYSSNAGEPYGNINAHKTQNVITGKINEEIDEQIEELEKCEICRTTEQKAQRIQRLANKDSQSSRWINLHPGSFLYRLSNQEYQDAVCLRFSILISNSRKWCACGSAFDSLAMHHHICRDSQSQITDLHERFKGILLSEVDKAKKYGKFESLIGGKEPEITAYASRNPKYLKDEDKRFGDFGYKSESGKIHIYDIGTCSLLCEKIITKQGSINFMKRKNGDAARHVVHHKELKINKEFLRNETDNLEIIALGFERTGVIDKVTKHALKQISKATCIGMAKGDTIPSESDFHMRFEYLMKQLSVCVQKWRSNYLNHGLKYRTLDFKPTAPTRIGNLPLPESNIFPAIIPGRVTAFSPILLPEEIPIDCDINNNDNLNSSYSGGESLVPLAQE